MITAAKDTNSLVSDSNSSDECSQNANEVQSEISNNNNKKDVNKCLQHHEKLKKIYD